MPESTQCVCRLRNEEALLVKNRRMGSGDVSKPGRPGPRAAAGGSGRADPSRPRRSTNDAPTPSPLSITNLSSNSSSRYTHHQSGTALLDRALREAACSTHGAVAQVYIGACFYMCIVQQSNKRHSRLNRECSAVLV